MKIIQLYTDLRLGGVERFVLDLCQELARLGHEVILATTWSDAYDEMTVLNGEQPLFRRIHFGKAESGRSAGIIWKINRLIWKEKPDVVHTHLFTLGYMLPSVFFGLPQNTKYVHTVHSQAEKECPTPNLKLTSYLYLHRTIPVSISERVHETMLMRYPGVKSPIILNGCSIDHSTGDSELISEIRKLRQSKDGGGRSIFLHIGHLSTNKNQRMLNHVARRLANEGHDFVVVLVGREDDKEYARLLKSEMCDNVHYLGPCKHAPSLLREADFFTLCSDYEGMPISLIEAIGNGCVPVCTPAGGIPSGCINHFNGLLAEKNTEEGLYCIMKEALEMPKEIYSRYREASLKLFQERFSMQTCVLAYEELYLKR